MQVSALGWAQLGTSSLGQPWLFLTGLTDVPDGPAEAG